MTHAASPSSSSRRTVTVADVARYAGVSTAVVSYVINNGPRPVAAATEARVREAIERLGYRPNLNARALRSGATDLIGLVLPDISNPYFAELAQAVEQVAAQHGYALVMATSNFQMDVERQNVQRLASRQVSGLLVASVNNRQNLDLGDRHGISTVLLDSHAAVPGFHTVGPDFRGGARELVEHLLTAHDARNVALVTGPLGFVEANSRERGWQEALARHGQPEGPILEGAFTRDGGYDMGQRLLTSELPDAVFAISDLQAVGLLRAFQEAGLQVPQDIAVVSFDGTKESEYTWPALTVARQPTMAMARAAVTAVTDPSPAGTYNHQSFPTDLVIRRSCGCTPPSSLNRERQATTPL